MALTKFPNGVSSFGVPLMGGMQIPSTTGNYYFVDSGSGSNNNTGLSPDRAMATIDAAVGQCTANNGDVILVMPGHNESITAATSLVVDVAGVSIIGLGQGATRPVLDFDNTAGSIEMDAANTRLSNIVLNASVSAVVVGINVDADNVELDHLETTYEATGDDFLIVADIDAFDKAYVHDNVFNTEIATAGANEAIRLDDAHNVRIINNIFSGQYANAAIYNAGALCSNLMILNNVIYNSDTSNYNGIDVGSLSSTGIVAGNNITALYATAVAKIYRDGDLTSHDNTFANAISERCVTNLPATTSA